VKSSSGSSPIRIHPKTQLPPQARPTSKRAALNNPAVPHPAPAKQGSNGTALTNPAGRELTNRAGKDSAPLRQMEFRLIQTLAMSLGARLAPLHQRKLADHPAARYCFG